MPDDPMKNKDRDGEHRRRREVGEDCGDPEKEVDGREVADALYGGSDGSRDRAPDSCRDEPRCDNCGKPLGENADVGCAKCDPRARGRPVHIHQDGGP
jgi:hypothetical protein